METNIKAQRLGLWLYWVLFSTVVIPVSYVLSLIVSLLIHGAFGFNMKEWGTPLSQMLSAMAGGAVIGLGTGIYQKLLLEKVFNVKSSWIYLLIIGFVAAELITGIVLWLLGLNRGELSFIEFNPLPQALIFTFIGLLSGFIQWPILRKVFSGSIYWIIASTVGWGICFLIMAYQYLFPGLLRSTIALVMFFCLGSLLYGAITGAAFAWFLNKKGEY